MPGLEIPPMDAPRVAHPTEPILQAFALGTLDEVSSLAVDRHLEGCETCRRRIARLSGDSSVKQLRDAGARAESPALNTESASPSRGSPKTPAPDPRLAGKLPPELAANSQYTILRALGRGGMGVVYLAHNTMLDRREVLKVLNREMLQRKGTYERFLREMRAAARLNHPNVVTAYSAQQWGNLLVFAMEYINGYDLDRLVKKKGLLPVTMACSFVHDAAQGLHHAHERGMVHRDIKPANLMYARQGKGWTVKILDFGLAKATSEHPIEGGLTSDGQALGTLDFLAPEQAVDARSADIRADIYSLGCTLYFLLSGGPPYAGDSYASIVLAHQSIEATPLNLVRPEVPMALAAVVAKMMAKDPSRRYQTPEEVAEALKPFLKPETGAAGGERTDARSPPENHAASRETPPALRTAGTKAATEKASQPEVSWERLIAIPEPEGLTEIKPKSTVSGLGHSWPGWIWPALQTAAILALVIACVAGLVMYWTAEVRRIPAPAPPPKRVHAERLTEKPLRSVGTAHPTIVKP
jgi:serine/threonine protein kinase